ncbi:hypothetical protein JCM8202_000030 [Rhodotorula sphaerocarpa]
MYRTAVASLRVAAPRRTFLTSRPAAKDLNHQVGDTLKAGIEKAESAADAVKDAAKPAVDAAKNVTGQASAEGKKAGAELGKEADKAKAEMKSGAQKAKAEMEKP